MADVYTRLSSFTRGQVKYALNENAVFNSLSDSAKNAIIDFAVAEVSTLRNNAGKETYSFDTANISIPLSLSGNYIPYTKLYAFEINVSEDPDVTEKVAAYGFTGTLSAAMNGDNIEITSTASDFVSGINILTNQSVNWDIDSATKLIIYPGWTGTLSVIVYKL